MNFRDLEIDVGQLRHRVTLQQYTEAADSLGQMLPAWTDQVTFWAYVEPLSGRELVNAQQIKEEVSHAVVCRYNPDIVLDSSKRLRWGTRIFGIGAAINVMERNIKRVLYCTEQAVPTS